MRTKIITAYWMDSTGYPYQSADSSRKTRYLGSLINHCKGIDFPIICYTHKKNEEELLNLKKEYNLKNLEIKLMELHDMKYHKEISKIRDENFDTDLSGRGPEIMWGKFQALEYEINDCDRIYWVDCGLQHPGIFPWMYCEPYGDKKYHINVSRPEWHDKEITQYNFTKLFNTKVFEKLNEISNKKIVTLASTGPQIGYGFYYENDIIDYTFESPYPIGGLIGGDSSVMKLYLSSFWASCEKILDKKVLCTEEAVMKLSHDENKDVIIPFTFSVYATDECEHFHFELWDEKCNKPKPLYMVWYDILNHS